MFSTASKSLAVPLVFALVVGACRLRYDDVAALAANQSAGGAAGNSGGGADTIPDATGGAQAGAAGVVGGAADAGAAGGSLEPCLPSPIDVLGTWYANGDTANDAVCSPLIASSHGQVPYGPGVGDLAWQFRSDQTSLSGDPDFVSLTALRSISFTAISVDAVVQRTAFNEYAGSNRMIFADDFGELSFASVRVALYLHENHDVFFRIENVAQDLTQEAFCSFGQLTQDQWTRLTGTWDGAQVACYLDGQLLETKPLPVVDPIQLASAVVGRNFPGDIDGLRLLTRALTADEVAAGWP